MNLHKEDIADGQANSCGERSSIDGSSPERQDAFPRHSFQGRHDLIKPGEGSSSGLESSDPLVKVGSTGAKGCRYKSLLETDMVAACSHFISC